MELNYDMKLMKMLNFNKESDGRWYIVLDEWEGDHSELEMVSGADTLLDILSAGKDFVSILISEEKSDIENPRFILNYVKDSGGGGIYRLDSETYNFDIWLCHVTKFVYGYLPKTLYIK